MRKLTDIKTKSDLCNYYGVSRWRTLENQLKGLSDQISFDKGKRYFTPDQVRLIISHLGKPLNPDELYDSVGL